MIIWLASYPRSGNTLLRTILKQSFDIDSYDYEARSRHESISESLGEDVKSIIGHKKFNGDWDSFYAKASVSEELFFVKTHSPPMDNFPVIYVVRDGRSSTDSYVSYHQSYTTNLSTPATINSLMLGDDYYGSWSQNYNFWTKRSDAKRLELRFEDLVNPDESLLKKIAAFISFEGTLKPFENPIGTVQAKNPDFFRKGKKTWGKSDKWSDFQEAVFLVLHGELMLQLNYCNSDELAEASRAIGQEACSLLKVAKRGFEDLNDLRFESEKKEKVIELLTNDLVRTKRRFKSLEVINWPLSLLRRSITIFRPRLGWLSQYEPRQMTVQNCSEIREVLERPKVSIVTPSFNQADYIVRTIESVLRQGYPNLEYFVQDGGSDDGTDEVLRQYESQISGWKSEPDSGQSQAINRGFSQTSGEIMAWLNSDDLLMPGAMQAVVAYFDKHPEVDVVYGDRLMIDENDHEIGRWILPGHDSNALEWADYIPQETMFWRREIWERVGAEIDESFRFAMDWDLLIRFHKAGAKFGHIPRFLGAFRIHETQKTSALINEIGIREMNIIRERIHGYCPDKYKIRRKIIWFLIKHIIVDLTYRVKTGFGRKRTLFKLKRST